MCYKCPCRCGWCPWRYTVLASLAVLLVLSSVADGQGESAMANLLRPFPPRPFPTPRPRPFGCECSNFLWVNPEGTTVGDCRVADRSDGQLFCYLNQPNNCPDSTESRQFCNMEVTKIGCRFGGGGATPFFASRDAQSAATQSADDLDMLEEEDEDANAMGSATVARRRGGSSSVY